MYEVELTKAQTEHKRAMHCRLLEFPRCDTSDVRTLLQFDQQMKELDMDAQLQYLALAEKELEDCFQPQVKAE